MTTSLARDSRALAEAYDRVSDLQFEEGKRLVERLEHRLRVARSQASTARFELGRAEDLSASEDCSFDAVCLSSVLHWVSDKARALAEIRRVLRPGGCLALTTLPTELSREGTVARVLGPLMQRPPYADQLDRSAGRRGCTSTELVLERRLELVELHVTQTVSGHESGEAFVQFAEASSFGNVLGMVPEALRASLRADLVSAFDGQRGPEGIVLTCPPSHAVESRATAAVRTTVGPTAP